jgi:hypothetical protein
MGKGKVLKIYDAHAVFENLETPGSFLVVTQSKDSGIREFSKKTKDQISSDLGNNPQILPFEAVFGFYDLLSGSYVALVIESEPYINNSAVNIRKAKKVLIIPLFRQARPLSDSKQADEDRYLKLLNLGFDEHSFYFSYSSEITLTQQRLAKINQRYANEPLWAKADLRFFWNRDLIEELVAIHADEWIVPFMSAYIELRSDIVIEEGVTVSILFISRRSRFRQGCRFIKRGIDDNGHVANFAEAEQILLFPDGKVTSFVQIRGSIPVKWQSPVHMRYAPNVFIEQDRTKSVECAYKHFSELTEKYSDETGNATIVNINLVDNKKDQGRLGVEYKEVVDQLKGKIRGASLVYEWFDFHHETKQKGAWRNLSKLVINPKIADAFKEMKYFCKMPDGVVTSWQRGTIRTNCMDNLDRTNVVQTLFARRSLVLQLGLGQRLEMNGAHILETPWKAFETIFKTMWTNNANAMSMGYTGTGALKADFTKTGKRTIKGMINDGINSCMRYYINNFTDGVKQDAIDLLIGKYRPNPLGPSPFSSRTSQQSLSNNFTKIFVLIVIIFTSLLLLLPPIAPFVPSDEADILERNIRHLQTQFALSMIIAAVIVAYVMYKIVKKGSKVGELMVLHPELCPEPLPPGRS